MKLEALNLENITIYLNNDYLDKISFSIENNAEQNFKDLFIKLKNIYKLDIKGYYNVKVYLNNNYGIIIDLINEDEEYLKIFGDTLDMKITFNFESEMFYKTDNVEQIKNNEYDLYYYDNNFYVDIKQIKLKKKEYLYLIENSSIIYGDELLQIKHLSKKIR